MMTHSFDHFYLTSLGALRAALEAGIDPKGVPDAWEAQVISLVVRALRTTEPIPSTECAIALDQMGNGERPDYLRKELLLLQGNNPSHEAYYSQLQLILCRWIEQLDSRVAENTRSTFWELV